MRLFVAFIYITLPSHLRFLTSPNYSQSPNRSYLFYRILIKRLFVFFSMRILSFMCRWHSGAKIQGAAFDTQAFSSQNLCDFHNRIHGYVLTKVSKLTSTFTTFLKFRLTMKFHLVFYCTSGCEPHCNELYVTFVYKMDACMYKAGETILFLAPFLHFRSCVQAYTSSQVGHIIIFQVLSSF